MKLSNNYFTKIITFQTCCMGILTGLKAQEESRPNVLFILADDLGWNDLGCMGSKFYETPNIDKLAQEGVCFTNAYAACQVSSPSRASIFTGKYTPNHGITNWIGEKSGTEWRSMGRCNKLLPAEYEHSLSLNEYTLAECLRDNGYTTFIAGKWHLGDKGSWPENHGFDINIGGWTSGSPNGGYFSPYQNPKLKDGPKGENLSMRLANETINFIKTHEKEYKGKPFFAFLSFYAVHGPIQTTKDYWKYFRDKAERNGIKDSGFIVDRTLPVRQVQDNPVYAGLIKHMDDAIGKVLWTLSQMGLDKNTIIIFTSDNGGVTSGDSFSTSLLPLRGGKGRQWEGGIRVPLLIKCNDFNIKGITCDTPVSGIDFYPTLLEYTKADNQKKQKLDGVSLIPLLKGENIKERPLFWHYPHYGNQGGEPSSIIRDGDWKLIFYHEDSRYELYNLSIDISESEPLNAQYPEKIIELKSKLDKWLKKVKAKMPSADNLYNPVKETEVKYIWKTKLLEQKEKERINTLKEKWQPNTNWWESEL